MNKSSNLRATKNLNKKIDEITTLREIKFPSIEPGDIFKENIKVLSLKEDNEFKYKRIWHCRCLLCKNEFYVKERYLKRNKSCGCLKNTRQILNQFNKKRKRKQ